MRTLSCVCLIPKNAQRTRPFNFSPSPQTVIVACVCARVFRSQHLYILILLFTQPHNLDLFMKCYETVCWLRSFLSTTAAQRKWNNTRQISSSGCGAHRERESGGGGVVAGPPARQAVRASVGSSAKRRIACGAIALAQFREQSESKMRLREMLLPCARSVTTILECFSQWQWVDTDVVNE